MKTAFLLVCVLCATVLPGCGETTSVDAGQDVPRTDTGADRDTGVPRDTGSDGNLDAPLDLDAPPDLDAPTGLDAGPRPLFESVGDGTVTLIHRISCPPALAFEADGSPLLAITSGTTRVMHLVGGAWEQLGGVVSDVGATVEAPPCVAMVVAADGTPYVAFQQRSAGGILQARVRRLEGTTWTDMVTLDGRTSGDQPVADLDVALDPAGDPVVAFVEVNTAVFDRGVTIRRLVGDAFVRDAAFGSSQVARMRLAIRPDGRIVTLITHNTGGFSSGVGVLENGAGTWSDLGDIDSVVDTTRNLAPGDVVAGATRIWATWSKSDSSGALFVHVARRDGTAWTDLDPTDPLGSNATLALHTGDEVTHAYSTATHADIRHHGGTSFGATVTLLPDVVFDSSVAWDHDQLYLAYAISFGGGSDTADLRRVNLP